MYDAEKLNSNFLHSEGTLTIKNIAVYCLSIVSPLVPELVSFIDLKRIEKKMVLCKINNLLLYVNCLSRIIVLATFTYVKHL